MSPDATPPTPSAPHRFVVLDSLRGICACTVMLFHFGTTGTIGSSTFVHQGWLFVDFFFVLSGFVIDKSYGAKLAGGFPVGRFLFLRLARVYPLHVFVLALFVAAELVILLGSGAGAPGRQAFDANHSLSGLALQLTSTHIFGIIPRLTWNGPSWSIAAELWTYLLFAIVFRLAGRHAPFLAAALFGAACLYLAGTGDHAIGRTYTDSLPRCICGFSLGVIAARVEPLVRDRVWLTPGRATAIELAAMVACIAFLASVGTGPGTLAAPIMFFAVILVFAREGGLCSTLLRTRPFQLLGLLSYSIYMTHTFVIVLIKKALAVGDRMFHVDWIAPSTQIVATGPAADAIVLCALATVIAFSAVTRRLIEVPANLYARRRAAAFGAAQAERLAPDM